MSDAPPHIRDGRCTPEQLNAFHEGLIKGFLEGMDACYAAHPKPRNMLLSNGFAIGWCDHRNVPRRIYRTPVPHDVPRGVGKGLDPAEHEFSIEVLKKVEEFQKQIALSVEKRKDDILG